MNKDIQATAQQVKDAFSDKDYQSNPLDTMTTGSLPNNLNQYIPQPQPHRSPCPSCGYCPHCGRGGYQQYPYYQPYPYRTEIWCGGAGGNIAGTTTAGNAPFTNRAI